MAGDRRPRARPQPDRARSGDGVTFGAHVVVHDGVVIGDGVVVQDGAILGKPPTLAPRLDRRRAATPTPLVIGDGAAICAQAIVFAGARDRRAARSSATRPSCASARAIGAGRVDRAAARRSTTT